ncbi:MAG: MerR family transcriptional regulator [Thermoanaerobacteraceae bacterium]|nr:MerR family transcriptional regulator [Thermoanaerobacteraceae bacterium]
MELLIISKAAKKLSVHPNSLRNWEKQGQGCMAPEVVRRSNRVFGN